MKRSILMLTAALTLVVSSFAAVPAEGAMGPKNVIIMISDGCGKNQIDAASLWRHGTTGGQVYEQFPAVYYMSTFSADGNGYDSRKTWKDFDYVEKGATDSAAAATAMSTGVKTRNGTIGLDVNEKPLKHAAKCAEQLGKATGVVTSVQLSHATPAGFFVHNESRYNYIDIAEEMIERSEVDVIMGCGHPLYNDHGAYGYNQDTEKDDKKDGIPDAHNYKYVGGVHTWGLVNEGRAGAKVDADHNGYLDDVWTLIQKREEFQSLASGPAPKRVLGVPCVHRTLQQKRGGDRKAPPFEVPFIPTVPTLAEMTNAALNVLDDDADGFFLVVEGGAVDWAGHANEPGRMIEEEIGFNNAVSAVVAWVNSASSWDETLVIVTGDHECGYLTRQERYAGDVPWYHQPLKNDGPGTLPFMQFNSDGHTNSLIPFFAKGAGAGAFADHIVEEDPILGAYIDNTSIGSVVIGFYN